MAELSFILNGRETTVQYQEGMNLLEVLRQCCGVVSPKDGCAPQGVCGCCTSLIDGKPVPVCLRKPEQVAGKHVTTLEGLDEDKRRILSDAFVKEGAIQCGYCTPGIVMRTAALMEKASGDGAPAKAGDRTTVAKALSGHLCRCTGYSRILDACQTAVEASCNGGQVPPGEPRRAEAIRGLDAKAKKNGIGSSSLRYRGVEHTFGEKLYVADMDIPGADGRPMLHGALLLSAHPRAVVREIDPSPALADPAVVRVLTAADVPAERFVGLIRKDWPVFVAVGETTRCVGDVIAMVVAESPFDARRATDLVAVDYEVLDPVVDPEAALGVGAPAVHADLDGNLLDTCSFERGDVDGALAEAAHVVSGRYVTQRIEHAFLEPEACLAVPVENASGAEGSGNGLKVYSQGQGVHDDQRQIASVLGLDPSRVDVELVTNGGAFGGKEDLSLQAQTCLAAHLLQRPVRCILTREQSLALHPKRHPITMEYTMSSDGEGRLTALRARMIGDTGAYASVGMKVLERAAGHSCGPYRVPHVDVVAKTVHTNNPPCGAMRGFGVNQTSFAIEGLMDQLAEKAGLDGYDIRERNVLAPGDLFATGQRMTESCGIRQTLEAVRDVYKETLAAGGFVGIGCGIKNTGIGNGMDDSGRLLIRVLENGRLEILTGYTEMGQGLFTILRQVVCEETGLDPERMDVRTVADPRVLCGMTTASRATALLTEAGRRAAVELKAALETQGLTSQDLASLAGQEFHGEFICDFTTKPGASKPGKDGADEDPKTHMTFSYATQVVLLDEKGRLQKVVAAHDVGRAINPLQCAGQIEGSVHMGLGYALSEDFPCSDGHPESLLLRDVGLLKAKDTPDIEVILVEVPDEVGGYGSKGVGEIGLVPTAGAVAGALYAFDGVRRYRLPMAEAPAAKGLVPKGRSAYVPERSGGPDLTGSGPFAVAGARAEGGRS